MKKFKTILFSLFVVLSSYSQISAQNEKPFLTFGVVTDVQYKNATTAGTRNYKGSVKKLQEFASGANSASLDFVIHLGDLIDGDFKSYDTILPVWNSIKTKKYLVLGNHDYNVGDNNKSKIFSKIGIDKLTTNNGYYDFYVKGIHFIVLNGNDVSYQAVVPNSSDHAAVVKFYNSLKNKTHALGWNGGIGKKQMDWLKILLNKADDAKEKVIIFCHFPILPEVIASIWNNDELLNEIVLHKSVKAYFAGHAHEGAFARQNDIAFVTFKGMVEGTTQPFAYVSVFDTKIEIKGFGNEDSRTIKFK